MLLTDFGWEPPPEVQERRVQVKPRMDTVCAGENTRALVLLQVEAFALQVYGARSRKVMVDPEEDDFPNSPAEGQRPRCGRQWLVMASCSSCSVAGDWFRWWAPQPCCRALAGRTLVLLYYGCATAVRAESTGLDLPFHLRWPQVFGVPHHQRNRENSRSHRFGCWRHCSQYQ